MNSTTPKLAIDDTTLKLSSDGVSAVYEARLLHSHDCVAIKKSPAERRLSREPHDIVKEIRLISTLRHANIIDFLYSHLDRTSNEWELWMPWIPYTLLDLLELPLFTPHECPPIRHLLLSKLNADADPPRDAIFLVLAKSIIYQIVLAVDYLHGLPSPIAHRDLKPGNILLTSSGRVQLIDFGVSWQEPRRDEQRTSDLWPETSDKMYFELGTGPFRAPELLFAPTTYNAQAADLWSLGTVIAHFFTPLRLSRRNYDADSDYSESDPDDDIDSTTLDRGIILPQDSALVTLRSARWSRKSLFEAHRGSIGLAWSIFSSRGTPTEETWPTFKNLPDASKVQFQIAPVSVLQDQLPNLPEGIEWLGAVHFPPSNTAASPLDLLHRLLIYPPERRLKATKALRHPWFHVYHDLTLPSDHPNTAGVDDYQRQITWNSKEIGYWLKMIGMT